MLIPVIISLLISTIFLNFSLWAKGTFLMSSQGEPTKIGRVLGVSEYNRAGEIIIEPNDNFNNAVVKVIEEAKILSLPRLFQPPQLDQPMRKFPKNQEKISELIMADFDFPAANGVILNYDDGSLLFAKRPDRSWPVASITKLFTAYTFLDYNPGWDKSYEIAPADKREGGKIYLTAI